MEKVLMLIEAFTFGCYLSYYVFKRKKKNQKEEIERYFENYKKNMACSNQDLVGKMKEIDLCGKVENLLIEKEKEIPTTKVEFYLKTEKDFLELTTESIAKDLQNCVVSYFVSQKSMAVNCETFILTKETCQTLLQVIDKNLTEKFLPYGILVGVLIIILKVEL